MTRRREYTLTDRDIQRIDNELMIVATNNNPRRRLTSRNKTIHRLKAIRDHYQHLAAHAAKRLDRDEAERCRIRRARAQNLVTELIEEGWCDRFKVFFEGQRAKGDKHAVQPI